MTLKMLESASASAPAARNSRSRTLIGSGRRADFFFAGFFFADLFSGGLFFARDTVDFAFDPVFFFIDPLPLRSSCVDSMPRGTPSGVGNMGQKTVEKLLV